MKSMQVHSPTFVEAAVTVDSHGMQHIRDYVRLWSQYIGDLAAKPLTMCRHLREDVQEDLIELHVAVNGHKMSWFIDEVMWRYCNEFGPYLLIPLSHDTGVQIDGEGEGVHVRHLCLTYWFKTQRVEFVQGYAEIVCEGEYDRSYFYDIFFA